MSHAKMIAGACAGIAVITAALALWLSPRAREALSMAGARHSIHLAEAPPDSSLRVTLSEVLSKQDSFRSLEPAQQDALCGQLSSMLIAYGRPSPDAYIDLMERSGGRLRTNVTRDVLREKWSKSPRRFPWKTAHLERLTAAPPVYDPDGAMVLENPGYGIMSRGCYPSFGFGLDLKSLVGSAPQIIVKLPMETFEKTDVTVLWRFVWSAERMQWIPLEMTQQGDGALGLPEGVF